MLSLKTLQVCVISVNPPRLDFYLESIHCPHSGPGIHQPSSCGSPIMLYNWSASLLHSVLEKFEEQRPCHICTSILNSQNSISAYHHCIVLLLIHIYFDVISYWNISNNFLLINFTIILWMIPAKLFIKCIFKTCWNINFYRVVTQIFLTLKKILGFLGL